MFSNSRNFVIQGGTFQIVNASGGYNENGSGGSGGLDILHRHIATGAMHDSAERSNAPTCHPDTRIAVLNDIMGWVEDEHRETDILWLHGPAGAGKTSICQTLAEMCQEKGELAATFFFARGAPGRDNDRSLVPTIAYQIAHSFEASRDYISTSVLKDPLQIFAKSLPTQMRQLVIQPLKQAIADITGPYPKLLIIDGLDECQPEDSQENILRVIYNTLKNRSLPLCILLASRKEPHIRDAFEGDLHEFTYPIALDDKYNPDQDIATYLRSSFALSCENIETTAQWRLYLCHGRPNLLFIHSWPKHRVNLYTLRRSSDSWMYVTNLPAKDSP
ncbi:hypothetical protein BDZ97DRAFT_782861 [Flammula alnicola]|nr:hypothetical protein BDZ97DRAFT_782861 [Flammula alnicola]